MSSKLAAIILTYNEAKHIVRCIESVRPISSDILVVDSFSTDDTVEIATANGARVVQHEFLNHAMQLNWALDQVHPDADWILRIDADEYLTPGLITELRESLDHFTDKVTGLVIRRRITFLRSRIQFGGFGGLWVLRIWRRGCALCETRWMDEHMSLLSGESRRLAHSLVDDNMNNISWWTDKHMRYASREAVDLLNLRYGFLDRVGSGNLGVGQVRFKRFLKERVYARLPLGVRPLLYFLQRMVFQLGILDSPRGWVFHFLQGLWYRAIVDVKIWEVERRMSTDRLDVVEAIRAELEIDPLVLELRS